MSFRSLFLALLALSWLNTASAQDAVLHLRCEGEAAGSYVFINGKAQGKCPSALAVAAGPIKLKVVKMLDLGHYRHFTAELSLAAGTKQSVVVVLGNEVFLTPQGRQEQLAAAKAKAATVTPTAQPSTGSSVQQSVASRAQQQQQLQQQLQLQQQQLQQQQRQLEQQQQQQQAVIAQQAEIQAQPSQVKGYLDSMSTKGNAEGNPSSATIATSYAPLLLPMLTTSDISAGNSLALSDPAGFGNPDSMVAKAIRLQEQRTHQEPPVAVAQR